MNESAPSLAPRTEPTRYNAPESVMTPVATEPRKAESKPKSPTETKTPTAVKAETGGRRRSSGARQRTSAEAKSRVGGGRKSVPGRRPSRQRSSTEGSHGGAEEEDRSAGRAEGPGKEAEVEFPALNRAQLKVMAEELRNNTLPLSRVYWGPDVDDAQNTHKDWDLIEMEKAKGATSARVGGAPRDIIGEQVDKDLEKWLPKPVPLTKRDYRRIIRWHLNQEREKKTREKATARSVKASTTKASSSSAVSSIKPDSFDERQPSAKDPSPA